MPIYFFLLFNTGLVIAKEDTVRRDTLKMLLLGRVSSIFLIIVFIWSLRATEVSRSHEPKAWWVAISVFLWPVIARERFLLLRPWQSQPFLFPSLRRSGLCDCGNLEFKGDFFVTLLCSVPRNDPQRNVLLASVVSLRGHAVLLYGRGNICFQSFGWSFEEGSCTSSIE